MVIEDDYVIAENLKENLMELGYREVGIAHNYREARSVFERMEPDIMIVDIDLNGSAKNGIEIMKEINSGGQRPIIYLTGIDEKTFRNQAKITQPAAFLFKPASKRQLDVTIDFALSGFYQSKSRYSYKKGVPSSTCPFISGPGYFFIKNDQRFDKVYVEDIAYIRAGGAYCTIVTDTGTQTVSVSLRSFLEQLQSDMLFRCHRSYAVNINQITSFDETHLLVRSGNSVTDISLGNKYKEELMERLFRIKSL